jgi:hypothetical protein
MCPGSYYNGRVAIPSWALGLLVLIDELILIGLAEGWFPLSFYSVSVFPSMSLRIFETLKH